MAARKTTTKVYETHCHPKQILASSRCAIKIQDNYYTIETSETREVINLDGIDMEKEFKMLFDELNNITDAQVQDIIETFSKKSR